jgi:hypothetical protein
VFDPLEGAGVELEAECGGCHLLHPKEEIIDHGCPECRKAARGFSPRIS